MWDGGGMWRKTASLAEGKTFQPVPRMTSGVKLPKAGALAVEPLFSSALQALTTAQPDEPNTSIFLASAAARLAGLPIKSSKSVTMDAGVQCGLPWVGHQCSASSSAKSSSPTRSRNLKTVAEYLQQPTVEELERIMDATLRACSARAKQQPAPSTDEEWRALAATEMVRVSSGLSIATVSTAEVGLQASVGAFASHAPLCMKRAASPSA